MKTIFFQLHFKGIVMSVKDLISIRKLTRIEHATKINTGIPLPFQDYSANIL